MKLKIYYLAFLAASAIGCSNPLDKEFNRDTAEADFTRIVKLRKIDSAEAYVMSHFMVEHDLIGAQVLEIGATYRDILDESKLFWEKTKNERKVKTDSAEAVTVNPSVVIEAVPSKDKVEQSQWSSSLKYTLKIRNTTEKTIRAFKGSFIFTDAFGESLHEVEYKYLNALAPGASAEKPVTFRIQHIVSPNKVVQYSEVNPFSVTWKETQVIAE